MDKLKMHTANQAQARLAQLRALFPACITEARDERGQPRLAVDFDLLRQELAEHLVEGAAERYRLDWPGKREALLAANTPIAKTLRPCRGGSVDFDRTRNLFVEGDNLDALKLLQETYLGQVKLIYIDPPYNTGHDFIYPDNFTLSLSDYLTKTNQRDAQGRRLVANPETNGRFHSDWLSMIYPRLKLARNLLREDGVLLISIDDHEVHNLTRICIELFGEENFVAQLAVQLNPRGRHLDRFVAKTHESILVFVKDVMNEDALHGLEKQGRMVEDYNRADDRGAYRLLGLRNRNQAFNPLTRPNLYYPLYVDPSSGAVALARQDGFSEEVWPDAPDGTKTCWTWSRDKVEREMSQLTAERRGDAWRIARRDYLHDAEGQLARSLVKSLWTDKSFSNDMGRKTVMDLFGAPVMDFPKSTELLRTLVRIGTHGDDDLVMDFFAGSATTAHAVLAQNAADGGRRRFIMVQLPEPCAASTTAAKAGFATIAELAQERIRRAGQRLLASYPDWQGDVGFRLLKVDSSNLIDAYYLPDELDQARLFDLCDTVKADRGAEDLLFQVLLDWGLDLSLPIRAETLLGKTVYFVDRPPSQLVACFDEGVDDALVEALARLAPARAVFRDGGFASAAVKLNAAQIFKRLAPASEVRAL